MRTPTAAISCIFLALVPALAPAGCTSAPEIPAAASAAKRPLVVGFWTSELDGTTLDVREDGSFIVARAARGAEPAATVPGAWRMDGTRFVVRNADGAASCAGVDGVYEAEVVRDTVRFTLVDDDCLPRETHMAWPWKRDTRR
ncbi:MAG: hypothetical protein LW636_05305 [Planctomycetaceae bacterium]|jgi:hypothetical protein|nr:hypothetical protein [Planctomycetaceae bacterium]